MSTADIAVFVTGAVALAEIGERAWFAHRIAARLQLGCPPNGTMPAAGKADPAANGHWPLPPLPPQAYARQLEYNRLCSEEGLTPDQAAAKLGIIAGSTKRDYERRRTAAA